MPSSGLLGTSGTHGLTSNLFFSQLISLHGERKGCDSIYNAEINTAAPVILLIVTFCQYLKYVHCLKALACHLFLNKNKENS